MAVTTTIRTMVPEEFFAVHQLNSRWMGVSLDAQADAILSLQFRVMIEHFHDSCFLAEVNAEAASQGKPVGLLIGFASQSDPEASYIHALGVAPAYRRSGLGRTLVQTFCDMMARRGCKRVSLVTWPENPVSQSFYDKTGFVATVAGKPIKISGITASKDYYGPGRHMVLYVKNL